MDRGERDRYAARTDQTNLGYAESACLETPPDLFAALHREFQFDIDLTANEQNHLLPQWFGPGSDLHTDALRADWRLSDQGGGRIYTRASGYSNPAYGAFVTPMLGKAVVEMQAGFTSVLLLPLRISKWYKALILPYADEVRHLPRVTFWYKGVPRKTAKVKNKEGLWTGEMAEAAAMFDSIVVVFQPQPLLRHACCPHFSEWDWRKLSHAVDPLQPAPASHTFDSRA